MIAALFVRADSIYKQIPGVDAWDAERDALRWPGGSPAVYHPPCRAWATLRHHAKPREGEKDLALWSVAHVRKYGGVIEHPHRSTLWPVAGLPEPGQRDRWGGWTLTVDQHWWGHRAQKRTRLYIVGCEPGDIPVMPMAHGRPLERSQQGHVPPINQQAGVRGDAVRVRALAGRAGAALQSQGEVMTLPNDKHRCPGKALVYTDTASIVTDPYCASCRRLQAGIEDRAQWVADGRPRIDGGAPAMRVPWMPAPAEMPCSARLD